MNLSPVGEAEPVSVVIPARDAAATLPAAVTSALTQEYAGPLDVVVAAAPSSDRTVEVAAELADAYGAVQVVENPAGTAPAGLNVAWRAADGRVIVRLDAHAQLPPGYVRRAVELLRETGAANVGGMQFPAAPGGFRVAVAAAMASPLGSGGARYRSGGRPGDTDTVYLGVFHREALEHVGGFDERLTRNQDYELNHRLQVAGGRVYFHPDLMVQYRPRGSLSELARQYLVYGAWKRHVVGLHPESVRVRQLVPPLLVLALVATSLPAVLAGWWWLPVAVVGAYLVALTAGAVHAVARYRDRATTLGLVVGLPALRDVPMIVAALATMHVSWGVGFLLGGLVRE